MKKHKTETGKRVRASAYSITLLLLIIAGCEGITNTDHSVSNQLNNLTGSNGVFSSAVSDSYNATVLPSDGLFSVAYLVADDGSVFGINKDGYHKAVKWTIDANGNISDPVSLGSLPDPYQEARHGIRGMNTNGDTVLGTAANDQVTDVAGWIWVNGNMTLLPHPDGATRVWPHAVNDEGVVVGQIEIAEGDGGKSYAALWMPPYNTDPILLTRMEDYILNSARGINNDGVITGWFRSPDMPDILGYWVINSEGNELSGPTKRDGIEEILLNSVNLDLDVTGSSSDGDNIPYIFRSDEGVRIDLEMLDGHNYGHAVRSTNRTVDGTILVAGFSRPDKTDTSDPRAVLWSADANNTITGPQDLGLPDRDQISTRPPRYLEYISAIALSVNMQGWTAGVSKREDGKNFATIWLPEQDDSSPPPGDLTASFTYSCSNTATCEFTDTSTGENIESRTWDPAGIADDGKHTFDAGEHTVTLTITDSDGNSDTASETISCKSNPRHGVRCS